MKHLLSVAAIAFATPAAAQMDMSMPGMEMPAKPAAKPPTKPRPAVRRAPSASSSTVQRTPNVVRPAARRARPKVRQAPPPPHDMLSMPGMTMPAAPTDSALPSEPAPAHDMSSMPGMGSMPSMPGMLTDAQLKELDAARGTEFNRLFLTYMIQHHRGAVTMVRTLFSSSGAGQDETVFKFASDVEVDQSTEIRRMFSMMLEMGFIPPSS